MKKMLACLLALLLLCASALAETVAISLADGELTFKAFNGGHVLTAETSASVFNRLGMSQRETLKSMEEQGIDALMFNLDFTCEVLLSVYENDYPAFTSFTDEVREQVCDSFREHFEQYGYEVHDVSMQDKGDFTFVSAYITLDFADGTVEQRVVYQTSFEGYDVQMTMFIYEDDPSDGILLADRLMSSMRYETNPGAVTLSLPGAAITLSVPETMIVHTSAEDAGVALPEAPYGEVVGCAAGEEFILLWQLDEKASGDMDRLSDAGVRALYQARAKSKKSAGYTVTRSADHPDGRQRYIITEYTFTDETGRTWYASEYYTKQAGWGASVTAYSGTPFTDDLLTMLEAIAESQMVSADE